ncbi:hypothetical protein V6N13_099520 [Hibiscus sabdariffa]|uniref:Ninja-family protein n=1 Tax=Hibiscus sabdariffa TaxID=183260 RepID=A0ABR2PZZ0_9ROSI
MAEPKVSQEMDDQINFLFQDKHQMIRFFPGFPLDGHVSKQTQDSNPEPDLNLRLSLGGNDTKQNPFTRSSSISGELVGLKRNFVELAENTTPESYLSLPRSCSLPAEVDHKSKRAMKRAEAKKRVEEKLRNAVKGTETDKERLVMPPPRSPAAEFPAWAVASAAKNPALIRAIAKIKEGLTIRRSQGQGASSSSNLMKPEPRMTSDATTGKFIKLEPKEIESKNPTKKAKLYNSGIQDDGMALMKTMPSVTTTGGGPGGRKIEGILYKYTKEQVIIVCVCHAKFLSPEEFVKHAGGKDVANPMKHINVGSTSY